MKMPFEWLKIVGKLKLPPLPAFGMHALQSYSTSREGKAKKPAGNAGGLGIVPDEKLFNRPDYSLG
jgi:hypothetical protein